MENFEITTIKKAVNTYFDGKVTSRTITFADGEVKSLGVMLPGEYEFATADKEIMEIYSGALTLKLPTSDTWETIKGGMTFEVPANTSFQVKVTEITDYCCSYIKA